MYTLRSYTRGSGIRQWTLFYNHELYKKILRLKMSVLRYGIQSLIKSQLVIISQRYRDTWPVKDTGIHDPSKIQGYTTRQRYRDTWPVKDTGIHDPSIRDLTIQGHELVVYTMHSHNSPNLYFSEAHGCPKHEIEC
jgi:hypothetical protein